MSGERLTIKTPDGEFSAYVARPTAAKAPAVVVIQEIFGVNAVMRETADWLAGEGYLAICPDLFWRIEPGIDITDKSKAEWDRAFELFGLFDAEALEDGAPIIGAAPPEHHIGPRRPQLRPFQQAAAQARVGPAEGHHRLDPGLGQAGGRVAQQGLDHLRLAETDQGLADDLRQAAPRGHDAPVLGTRVAGAGDEVGVAGVDAGQ